MTKPDPVAGDGPEPRRPRLLIVDDHEIGRKSLARLMGVLGYEITAVKDGESAIVAMEQDPTFDYVLTDLRLPDVDGRDVVRAARRLLESPRIALITGWDVEPGEADRLGIDWIFLKPLDVQTIVTKLKECPPRGHAADFG